MRKLVYFQTLSQQKHALQKTARGGRAAKGGLPCAQRRGRRSVCSCRAGGAGHACTLHLGPLQVPKPWRCGAGLPGMQAQAKRKAAVLQNSRFVWRCRPDLNWCIEVLQTSALPLGYGTICKFRRHEKRRNSIWSGLRGSNSLPPPWQGGALPDELKPQMVPPIGIEPMTRGFSVPCSTN